MTSTGNDCSIAGAFLTCPADTLYSINGDAITLDATISCPLAAFAQVSFVEASQQGLCSCDSSLLIGEEATPMNCECYACPQGSQFGFAYDCTDTIFANCKRLNCSGDCNGSLGFLDIMNPTVAPSFFPSDYPSFVPTQFPSDYPSFVPTRFPSEASSPLPITAPTSEMTTPPTTATMMTSAPTSSASASCPFGIMNLVVVALLFVVHMK